MSKQPRPRRTPWYPANTYPARAGWYERDHRGCDYTAPSERRISQDRWVPVRDKKDPLYPGLWYVLCDPYEFVNPFTGQRKWLEYPMDDASRQDLPWRGLTAPAPYLRPDP